MSEQRDNLDFLDTIEQRCAEAKAMYDIGQMLVDEAAAAQKRIAEQAALEKDLADGSVEALLRVKERLNAKLDEAIEKSLGVK